LLLFLRPDEVVGVVVFVEVEIFDFEAFVNFVGVLVIVFPFLSVIVSSSMILIFWMIFNFCCRNIKSLI